MSLTKVSPSEKESTLKGKNLLPANSLLLEQTPCQKWLMRRIHIRKTEVPKVDSLVKWRIIYQVYPITLIQSLHVSLCSRSDLWILM